MNSIKKFFLELSQYPSAMMGLSLILALVIISIYTVIKIPYPEAVSLWRGDENVWYKTPQTAQPKWVNWFRMDKLPETFSFNTADGQGTKTENFSNGTNKISITFPFEYDSKYFPQEMSLYFKAKYTQKEPFVTIKLITPDGRKINIDNFAVGENQNYRFSQDQKLQRRLKGVSPEQGIFIDPKADPANPVALPGKYELQIDGVAFEQGSTVDAEFIVYGQVYGWAGTDHHRRDLTIPLLWGGPIALAFGLLAAFGTTILTMIIAAFGTWYG